MKLINVIEGICLWWGQDYLIRAVGRRIDVSDDNGASFTTVSYLDFGYKKNQILSSKLGSRLFRLNPKHCVRLNESEFILLAANIIFLLNVTNSKVRRLSTISGKRPLRMAFDGSAIYYGEYLGNPERRPINVYKSQDMGRSWEICHTFTGIRHVHGVYHDKKTDSLWITTGDYGSEAAIWQANLDFTEVDRVLSGSQQTRVIDLLFNSDQIIYGTDAPDDQNHIYRLNRITNDVVELAAVEGPVFHAFDSQSASYFSTACEPSIAKKYTHAVLYRYCDGHVSEVTRFKKDIWSMKYFQYGQILFPSGPGLDRNIWCSSFACENDQRSFHFQS